MVAFQESIYSVEEGTSIQVCGEVSLPTEALVSVTVSINGNTAQENADFVVSLTMLSFQPGQVESCTTASAVDDPILEGSEEFTLTLQSNNNLIQISSTAGLAMVAILNQDSTFNYRSCGLHSCMDTARLHVLFHIHQT